MDQEVLAGVVRQCAVHNGRTTDGDKPWMEQGGAVLRHFVVHAIPPFKGNLLPTSCPSAPPKELLWIRAPASLDAVILWHCRICIGALTEHIY